MDSTEELLRANDGVQSIVGLYAALNDWYANIHQERKGVRACERVTRVRDDGLVPTAQRYFEYVATENNLEFDSDAEELLERWVDDFRPDYVEAADDHDWEEYERGLTRGLLDAESRIGRVALNVAVEVNNATINIRDEEDLPVELQEEFDALWQDWFLRLDDLYWYRRGRLYNQIVKEIEEDCVESEDKVWERYLERYPELPCGTRIGGEEVY